MWDSFLAGGNRRLILLCINISSSQIYHTHTALLEREMIRCYLLLALVFVQLALVEAGRSYEPPFYTNSKHILELTSSTFDDYVYSSNYTTIVEFYAPWCGYCKQLKPEFEKAANQGHRYANFAAVNCDAEINKSFCASQNIKGFPTLITYRPPKTFRENRPRNQQYAAQVYEQERTSKAMVNAMKGSIKSFVKRLDLERLEKFLTVPEAGSSTRVLLLTDSHQVSPLYKALAIDYKDVLKFSYLHLKDKDMAHAAQILSRFDTDVVASLPKIIAVDSEKGVVVYDGEVDKTAISHFLTQFGTPVEGVFSERQEIIDGIKSRKYKSFTHYRKQKAKREKKEAQAALERDPASDKTVEKDEL